jgi:hypothetical protein
MEKRLSSWPVSIFERSARRTHRSRSSLLYSVTGILLILLSLFWKLSLIHNPWRTAQAGHDLARLICFCMGMALLSASVFGRR